MENNNQTLVIVLVIALLLSLFRTQKYEEYTAEEWAAEYEYTNDKLESYIDALDEANSNIEDAKYYVWESYDDMGYALDDLETVDVY